LNNIGKSTVAEELAELVENAIFAPTGKGRSAGYKIIVRY
jgi:hypothetical protein